MKKKGKNFFFIFVEKNSFFLANNLYLFMCRYLIEILFIRVRKNFGVRKKKNAERDFFIHAIHSCMSIHRQSLPLRHFSGEFYFSFFYFFSFFHFILLQTSLKLFNYKWAKKRLFFFILSVSRCFFFAGCDEMGSKKEEQEEDASAKLYVTSINMRCRYVVVQKRGK